MIVCPSSLIGAHEIFLVHGPDARTHIEDEELFFLFRSVADLTHQDRLEAKQLVTTFLEQRRGR